MSVNEYQVVSYMQQLYTKIMQEKVNNANEYLGDILNTLREKQTNAQNTDEYFADLCQSTGYYISASQFALNYLLDSLKLNGNWSSHEMSLQMKSNERLITQDSIALGTKLKVQSELLYSDIQGQANQIQYDYLYNQIFLDILINFIADAEKDTVFRQMINSFPYEKTLDSIVNFTEKSAKRFFSQS